MKSALKIAQVLRRPVLLTLIYTAIFVISLALSYELRFDFTLPGHYAQQLILVCLWAIPVKLVALRLFGHFNELLSYFGVPDLRRIVAATGVGSVLLFLARFVDGADAVAAPRGVIMTDFVLSIAGICAVRLALRSFRERSTGRSRKTGKAARRVAIIGAGDVGAALARDLISKPWLALQPVAFFDDFKKTHSTVHGIPILGRPEALFEEKLEVRTKLGIQEAIIAMPSAPAKRIGEVVRILQEAGLRIQTVPSMAQLASGQVKVSALRAVEIQDLLGRAIVEIDNANVERILEGRVVMVTGAGGSIGSELCRQIAAFRPEKLLLVERSEPHLFAIEQELLEAHSITIIPLVADVMDVARMEQIFVDHAPDTVFHAAAHKHVPMMEHQPAEAVKNNSIGTAHLATLSAHHGVHRFVLISTDKAINPTSVMGASKRLAEMFLQALHASEDCATKFMAVRFGNVLGSSGSVVPIFSRQIEMGGPVKVTHQDMTRYFMTIPEATRLVLQSAAQGDGGEIFVLDMGPPVKIVDLARQMIELSGLIPGTDIEIVFTGLRPGEKLFEELSHKGENLKATNHPKIMRFVADPLPLSFVKTAIEEFVRCINVAESEQVKAMLKALIPEYKPFGGKPGASEAPPRRLLSSRDRRPEISQPARVHVSR